MPMMATTIINSMSVKPCCSFFIAAPLSGFGEKHDAHASGELCASAVPGAAHYVKTLSWASTRRDSRRHCLYILLSPNAVAEAALAAQSAQNCQPFRQAATVRRYSIP